MNENINLCELLKGHEGEKFYSPIYGEVVVKFDEYLEIWPIDERGYLPLASNGHLKNNPNEGECLIFPSKDQRDWNEWVEEQKPKVPKTWENL